MILAIAMQDEPVPPGADPALIAGDNPQQAWQQEQLLAFLGRKP